MTNIERFHAENLPDLMDRITKNSIGLDNYFDRFFDLQTSSNYPPYNLINVSNTESRLEIALAGFKKDEVKVYTEYGKLVVESKKEEKEEANYSHRGIARRSFNRSWTIADDTVVKEVNFEDGLLTVTLGKVVPDHHQRKDWI
jgi:molecular chaperone IbpA|tara:strand:- start:30 stop:458 length:429 start_codon:yes stop_codon:yes gene_type:complete